MKKLIVAFILALGIGGFSMTYIACGKGNTNNTNNNNNTTTDGGTNNNNNTTTDGGAGE